MQKEKEIESSIKQEKDIKRSTSKHAVDKLKHRVPKPT